jgi:L-ascorbate metabolism protein UlaG (beta-lactamase superfamily)
LRKRAQELANVIARCYAVLILHGFHDHDRGEHVRRKIRESGPKNVRVDGADACEKSSGEGAARENEVVVLGRGQAVDVDHC